MPCSGEWSREDYADAHRIRFGAARRGRSASGLFGTASALQFVFQALGLELTYHLILAAPYVLTLLALAGVAGRARAPEGLGKS